MPKRCCIRLAISASFAASPAPVQSVDPQSLPMKSAMGSIRSVGTLRADQSAVRLKLGAPARPRFVKIWMTPLDASVPYSVAAAAPLRISMRSIDSGGMSSRRLGLPVPLKLTAERSIRMPSR